MHKGNIKIVLFRCLMFLCNLSQSYVQRKVEPYLKKKNLMTHFETAFKKHIILFYEIAKYY